ncbi:MAG: DUF4097 domain-containing protein [Candidatus Aminicenantaceae bacterium]
MKRNHAFLTLIFVLPFILYVPLRANPRVVTFEKNFSVDPSQPVYLEFRDEDGNFRFSSWEKDIVVIKVRKETKEKNEKRAEKLLNDTKIKISQNNNEIKIRIQYPKIKGIFFWLRDYRRVEVFTEVMLPLRSDVSCFIDDGSIYGEKINGRVSANIDDGTIRLTDIQDSLKVKADDGRVLLNNIEGEVVVETDDGDIELSGRISKLNLFTDDGDVNVRIAPHSSMGEDWKVVTDDGSVEFFLSEDFSAELDIRTDGGDFTTHIPLTLRDISVKQKISGKINQGGRLLIVKTDDGDVALRKLNGDDSIF